MRRGTGKKEKRSERAREKERSGRGGPILDYFVPGPGMTVSWPNTLWYISHSYTLVNPQMFSVVAMICIVFCACLALVDSLEAVKYACVCFMINI